MAGAIDRDDVEPLGERGQDPVIAEPLHVLGVQQQQRRPVVWSLRVVPIHLVDPRGLRPVSGCGHPRPPWVVVAGNDAGDRESDDREARADNRESTVSQR